MPLQCQKIEIKKLPLYASDITNFTSAVCAVVTQMSSIEGGEPLFTSWAATYSGDLYHTFTTVNTYSSIWQQTDDSNVNTFVYSNSANILQSNNVVNNTSGNWNSVYTSYNSSSANFLTNSSGNSRYVKLSGDVMTGGLSSPSISTNNLYVAGSTINFFDGNGNIIQTLKSSDVGNFKSNYTLTNSRSANWENTYIGFSSQSANNFSVYNTVNTNSGSNWNYQGSDLKSLTGNWQNTYIGFSSQSANNLSVYNSFNSNSSNYNSVYNTVNTNSGSNWNYQGTDIKSLTSNWQDTYVNFSAQSANNLSVYTNVNTNSANWNYQGNDIKSLTGNWQNTYTNFSSQSANNLSVYTNVNTNSANWNYQGNDIKSLTSNWQASYTALTSSSANWNDTRNTVQTNSSTNWNYQGTDIKSLTGNWQNTYSTVSSNSASWGTSDRLNNGTVQVVLSSDNNLHFPTGTIGDTLLDGGFNIVGKPGFYAELASYDGNVFAWASDISYGNPVGGGFSIGTNTTTASAGYVWTFGNNGLLRFPDGTIQSTAFTDYLSALNDVSIPSPVNGQVLTYNSITKKWNAGTPLSASGATGYYGSFYDTTAQTLTSTTQAKRINIAQTYEHNGVSIDTNRIVFNYNGVYELIYSIQYKNTDASQQDIYIWLKQNGVDIPNSSSVFTIPARKNASIPAQLIAVSPFMSTLTAGDFIELYWHCNSTSVTVETFTTHANPTIPDTPGVIVTVKQVTNVQIVPTVGAYLPLSGGTLTGAVSTTNVLYTTGGNSNQWNNAYSTVNSNSANWVNTNDTRLVAFAADAGSTDAYAATLSPAPSAYTTGAHYRFKANTANTGAATINFNSLGAKTIVKAAGGITTTLADNDIRAGQWVDLVYDGTNMQMQSTLGNLFNPAIPGPIGGTTPNSISSTDVSILGSNVPLISIRSTSATKTAFIYQYYSDNVLRLSNTDGDILHLNTGYARFCNSNVAIEGYLTLRQITTPASEVDIGKMYAKNVSGTAEMFVMDEAGNEYSVGNSVGLTNTSTGTTPTELFLNGTSTRLSINTSTVVSGIATITGVKSDGSAVCMFTRKFCIKRVGSTTSIVGTVETVGSDIKDVPTPDVTLTADDTNDALAITVTGVTAETWKWKCIISGLNRHAF